MTYDSRETGTSTSAPVELYEFVGTFNTYRMTTSPDKITNSLGTFQPIAVTRTAIEGASQEEGEMSIDISVPFNHPMCMEYIYSNSPPKLTVNMYRLHRGYLEEFQLIFTGEVLSFNVEDRIATFRVPSVFSWKLEGLAPNPKYQAPCNHVLFDEFCSVSRGLNTQTSTVVAVNDKTITVDASTFLLKECAAGEMIWAAGDQRRMIVSNTGNVFKLTFPFSGLLVGETVKFSKGCDHSFTTCRTKFSNGINFGGTPLVPKLNPFTSKL